tara:strand:+ start:81 stop:650 length:570 start_codon:yes stop_codon:yes gene_type:complete
MSTTKIKHLLFKNFLKCVLLTPLAISFLHSNTLKSGVEFQWENTDNFKRLSWYQRDSKKSAKNTVFLFLKKSARKTGLLKINVKVPKTFFSKIKKEKVNLCQVQIGGFSKSTKCLVNTPADIELNKEKNTINIYPLSPIPSGKDNYAIVLKVTNPNRGGLYQFHSFGQSSGNIPVSFYLGSWTLKMQSQ